MFSCWINGFRKWATETFQDQFESNLTRRKGQNSTMRRYCTIALSRGDGLMAKMKSVVEIRGVNMQFEILISDTVIM